MLAVKSSAHYKMSMFRHLEYMKCVCSSNDYITAMGHPQLGWSHHECHCSITAVALVKMRQGEHCHLSRHCLGVLNSLPACRSHLVKCIKISHNRHKVVKIHILKACWHMNSSIDYLNAGLNTCSFSHRPLQWQW